MAKKSRKGPAVVGGAVVLVAALLARFPNLPGLGPGLGLGTGMGSGSGVSSEAEQAEAEADAENTDRMEETADAEITENTDAADVSIDSREAENGPAEILQETEEGGAGDAEDPEVVITEYVIEIKKDQYFLDGLEISKKKIEDLLLEENASFRIDNNYGSQKAVSELKELFLEYSVPFVE